MNILEPDADLLYKQLLIKDADEVNRPAQDSLVKCHSVLPQPGFCLKTKTDKGGKVFVNVCKGENLPAPKDISDEELLKLLEAEDPSGFRIPMSIGEAHAEVDKGGYGCTAYDVVINPSFFASINSREILLGFFLTVVLEGLEAKYSMTLDRNWVILKNRKFVGSLSEQNVRAQSKPWIMEMDTNKNQALSKRSLITEAQQSPAPEPPYTILQEPPEGYPEFLVTEVHLPKIKTCASLLLDVGEDRLVLDTRSNVYRLDVYLPFNLIQDEVTAQFNRRTKILTVTMPVQPKLL